MLFVFSLKPMQLRLYTVWKRALHCCSRPADKIWNGISCLHWQATMALLAVAEVSTRFCSQQSNSSSSSSSSSSSAAPSSMHRSSMDSKPRTFEEVVDVDDLETRSGTALRVPLLHARLRKQISQATSLE